MNNAGAALSELLVLSSDLPDDVKSQMEAGQLFLDAGEPAVDSIVFVRPYASIQRMPRHSPPRVRRPSTRRLYQCPTLPACGGFTVCSRVGLPVGHRPGADP